jgi:hypothetical protein
MSVRREWVVLSDHEQRVWDDVERFWAEEVEEPPLPAMLLRRGTPRDPADLPALVVAGVWGAILIIFGALVAGLAVAVATALGWALWHHWPRLGGMRSASAWWVFGEMQRGSSTARRRARWT